MYGHACLTCDVTWPLCCPPSSTLLVRKRYRGTSELILGTDSEEDEEVEESLDSNSKSKDVENEGPTAEDDDPAAEDEGLVSRVEGPGVDDESYGLDGESHGVDDESYGLNDESYGIDGEGRGIKSDGLGFWEEEVVPEGQQQAIPVVGTAMSEPLGLGYGVLRRRELALEDDHVYNSEDGMVYIDVPVYPPLAPPVQRSPSPEWTSGLLLISPPPSVVPLPVSSLMIPLTIPLHIASSMATSTTTILVDEDQFIEERERPAVTFGTLWRPVLALDAWAGRTALQRELQEMRDHVTVLEQERNRRERGANRKVLNREWSRGMLERVVVIKLES
uniref:Uncharacterized protein n=1 Tax=Tanacetum cinerariifolium TaxID=118510 RepID=A0A699K963_TANCI|nr:hypothetical protein [Tanacetum cinerariifolium]